jgi:hypothetical protein
MVTRLHAPTPNPGRGSRTIRFDLEAESSVQLAVFDVRGRRVAALTEGRLPAGQHRIPWDARGLSRGVYFVRLEADEARLARKLIVR